MKELIIGVDGGGTRSRILIIDSVTQEVVGRAESGPANINTSVEESWNSILHGIENILKEKLESIAKKKFNLSLVAGLAGTEITNACEEFLQYKYNTHFNEVTLLSDAHIACLGAFAGQDGSILSFGTGTFGYQIYQGNLSKKIVGWGFPHSDEASGAWIGMEAIRLLLKAQDKRIETSPFLDFLFRKYENNLDKLVLLANQKKPNWFAENAGHIIEFYKNNGKGDPHLDSLMARATQEIIEMINALDATPNGNLPICFSGGLAPFLLDWLPQDIQQRIVKSKLSPEEGAVFYALNMRKQKQD
jgi:glucosamine kinase